MATASSQNPGFIYCENLIGKVSKVKIEIILTFLASTLKQEFDRTQVTVQDIREEAFYLSSVIATGVAFEKKPGIYLFSSNEICRHLLTLSTDLPSHLKETQHTLTWIDFESTSLTPHILSSASQSSFTETLKESLSTLESNYPLDIIPLLSLSDIIIFSSIYPLTHPSLFVEMNTSFPKLLTWIDTIARRVPAANKIISILPVVTNWTRERPGVTGFRKQKKEIKLPSNFAEVQLLAKERDKQSDLRWDKRSVSLLAPEITHPILPHATKRNFLITSALPYVNNVPHLGNIIGCVLSADVFARYCRARGHQTLFLCGTDEYGTATEIKAVQEGVTPQQVCDKYYQEHKSIYEWFQISFDTFGRTTTQKQTDIAQDIFWKIHKRGFITDETVEQLFCEKCTRFLADRFVAGICPSCAYDDAQGDQCDKCGKLINAVELIQPKCKTGTSQYETVHCL